MSAWTFCSWLAPQIEAFINLRRLSGTDYRQQTESLGYFDRFLVANGIHPTRMTREICDRYQDSLSPLAPSTRANRFCVVRLLCEYLTRTDPLSYIPERLPWPGSPRRPYIFRHEQVVALLTAALRLPPPGSLRPHTVRTLLGLRVGSLPPQQARIVQSLCNAIGAMTVKEISEDTFISDGNVSKQLGDLKQKGYVISERRGKESFYEMAEPLMRLCLEVKKQRGKPLKLVAVFLRAWFSPKSLQGEVEDRSGISANNARTLAYRQAALLADDAFEQAIVQKLAQEFDSRFKGKHFDDAMHIAEELAIADRPTGLIRKAQVHQEKGQLADALKELDHVISLPGLADRDQRT